MGPRALLAPPSPLPMVRAQPRGLDAPQGDRVAAPVPQMSPSPMFPPDPLSRPLLFLPHVLKSDLQTLPPSPAAPSPPGCQSCLLTVAVGAPACLHPAGRGSPDRGGRGRWKRRESLGWSPGRKLWGQWEAWGAPGTVERARAQWGGDLGGLAPQPWRVKLGVYRRNAQSSKSPAPAS